MSERKESASQYHILAQSKEYKILIDRTGGPWTIHPSIQHLDLTFSSLVYVLYPLIIKPE